MVTSIMSREGGSLAEHQDIIQEASAAQPVIFDPSKITIKQLYIFSLKLAAAGILVSAPIALLIWVINYAVTH